MQWIKSNLQPDSDSRELLIETARNIIFTVGLLYLIWHFIATLWWSDIVTAQIWWLSFLMAAIILLTVRLLERRYLLAQLIWQVGLSSVVLLAYHLYRVPEITIILLFLPLIATVTIGRWGTLLVEGLVIGLVLVIQTGSLLPALDTGYTLGLILGSLFTGVFGLGLSNNMISALSSASYHYSRTRDLLEETRQHRGEISRMLKEREQTNYQLERLNQMLQFARGKAEEAREDRDRFVLAVSHELRSPLNFILGFSDLMVNSPETYAKLKKWPPGLFDDVQEIYRSSTHLMGLINDILDLGQIDAQQMTIYRERAGLPKLVKDVKKMVQPAFAQKGLALDLVFEPDLPQVFVDCTRIRQVLLNLINNGLRFTQQGGVTISISKTGTALEVMVADTGTGIAPDDLAKVFDAFRQVGQDSWRRREGSGLGLAISKRFIELHGGEMWLESELGTGSKFYFTIPVLAVSNEAEPIVEHQGWRGLGQRMGDEEPLALLVTANSLTGRVIQQSLDSFKIVTVDDIESLPGAVAKFYPQAIFVDKSLSLEGRLRLRDLPYDLPVIGIFLPGMLDGFQSLPENVLDYLVKPVERGELIKAVRRLTGEIHEILVVDDDPAMIRFVTQAIKSADYVAEFPVAYQFSSANTGQDALAQLRTRQMDALLLDLDLPDMSGWDVLAQIQADPNLKNLPVIIISAMDFPQILYTHGRQVFDVMMRRPFSKQEMAAVLNAILASVKPVYPKVGNGENNLG